MPNPVFYIYIRWECWSSVNHYVVMCRTKCNIIWRVLNIYDRAIILYYIIYIFFFFNSWNIDCDPGFNGVFCETAIIRQLRNWNESKKYRQKNHWEFIWKFTCGCVWVCGCVYACICYSYIRMHVFMRLS